ncbi:pyruvate, water dikinase regulatory protein [Gorillibacterium sp. sgz5001074]|uniref:pyruvate, water dikinase regulatory protein n=1 Tax=Gorillibacterium sp. sgz5001074 TaxID=3446695 RepID=UPI003F6806DF
MSDLKRHSVIYLVSDSVGETAEAVARATIRQFDAHETKIKRYGHVRTGAELRSIVEEVSKQGGFITYTLVQPELREIMKEESKRLNIRAVDIMGPMMEAFVDSFDGAPNRMPGMLHRLDEDYFRRVEAIEFTVSCDDGRDPRSLLEADIILVGVSRTSKTPLSIFLAHKGYKVANLPLIPEVKPPQELYRITKGLIAGLTMVPEQMLKIRHERLRALGLSPGAKYAEVERIREELEYAHSIMDRLRCVKIDVTDKAIEETAGMILDHM